MAAGGASKGLERGSIGPNLAVVVFDSGSARVALEFGPESLHPTLSGVLNDVYYLVFGGGLDNKLVCTLNIASHAYSEHEEVHDHAERTWKVLVDGGCAGKPAVIEDCGTLLLDNRGTCKLKTTAWGQPLAIPEALEHVLGLLLTLLLVPATMTGYNAVLEDTHSELYATAGCLPE